MNDSGTNVGCCWQDLCGTSAFQAKLYVVDSAKEKRIGIGREWTLGSIQEGKVFMISDIAAAVRPLATHHL
jgi:hypothetical protein